MPTRGSESRCDASAGISAGIDLALLVTAEYYGGEIARSTARHMAYPYPESLKRRI